MFYFACRIYTPFDEGRFGCCVCVFFFSSCIFIDVFKLNIIHTAWGHKIYICSTLIQYVSHTWRESIVKRVHIIIFYFCFALVFFIIPKTSQFLPFLSCISSFIFVSICSSNEPFIQFMYMNWHRWWWWYEPNSILCMYIYVYRFTIIYIYVYIYINEEWNERDFCTTHFHLFTKINFLYTLCVAPRFDDREHIASFFIHIFLVYIFTS